MKNVCFFSGDITRGGGTEKAASMIANALYEEANYRIIFLSLTEQSPTPFFKINEGIKRYSLNDKPINRGAGYLKIIPKLKRFLKEQNIDVIIDIDIVLDSLSIPAVKGTDTKVVSWEHFNYMYENDSWYRRIILKYSVKRSDYVVTLTRRDKKAYSEKLGRNKNITFIYNPMDEALDYRELPKENLIVTVGHLIRRKGIDYLARVAKKVLTAAPNWKWAVLGEGDEMPFLKEFARNSNLEDRLILPGRVSNIYSYLNKAQIYVMTSRLEGLPMCLLEAKEYSIPIVTFDIPTGPDEVIEDGVNGFLIPPFDCDLMADKIINLIKNDKIRADFSAHAKDDIEEFKLQNVLNKWNELLVSLTAQEGALK